MTNTFFPKLRNLTCLCMLHLCFTLSIVYGQSGTGFEYNIQYNNTIGSSTNGFQLTNNFTLEMWIKINSNQAVWSNIFQLAGTNLNGNSQSGIRLFQYPGDTRLHFRLATTTDWNEGCDFINNPLPLGVWTHIAIVLNNNTLFLYQNGALQSSCPISSMVLSQIVNFYASGIDGMPATNATLNELRLWNVARSQTQIISTMMCQTPSQTNLVFYYGGPILNPGISTTITVGSQTTCFGTPVTFTATPTNGGTNPVYQWKKNNLNVGTNSNTYSTSNIGNNDEIKCVLTNPILCGGSATSNSIIMNIANTWTGAVSQQWTNPANWSCNSIPTGNVNIIIPPTTNQPIITN